MSQEVINTWLSKSKPHAWFDIDGTIKHTDKKYPNKFNPAVVGVLLSLKEMAGTGACTDQSPQELASFLAKMLPDNGGAIFTGPSILEGGHVLVAKGTQIDKEFQILTSEAAQQEMQAIVSMFLASWTAIADNADGWGLLPDVITPVALAQGKYQGVGSISIWEKGPDMHSPEYQGEYKLVLEWVKAQAEALQLLKQTELKEVGNGTLRVVQIGVGKASLLEQLHQQGAVDLGASLYCGDGLNDVDPAKIVKKYGGTVVAVANACPELKAIADVVADGVASDGVVEVFQGAI
ncbi:MAG: HAD hydrolase family protein [Patescibacteria group bacterium]|nr:HAD hydrolase family protein [Patescibacteria group bacterium]